MAALYRFLTTYEALIYLVLATGALFAARWFWRSWQEWKQASFKLEREFSLRRLSQASALLLLIGMMACGEMVMASFVIPGLPAQAFLATPTLDLFSQGASTRPPGLLTTTAEPASEAARSSGCTPGQVFLRSPEPGAEVSGVIELQGTVEIADFGFYKYEVSPRDSNTWATISAGRAAVRDGRLGGWDTTALTPGDYLLRLVASDNQGRVLPACVIPLRVVAPG